MNDSLYYSPKINFIKYILISQSTSFKIPHTHFTHFKSVFFFEKLDALNFRSQSRLRKILIFETICSYKNRISKEHIFQNSDFSLHWKGHGLTLEIIGYNFIYNIKKDKESSIENVQYFCKEVE